MIERWLNSLSRAGSCHHTEAVQTTGGIGDLELRSQAHAKRDNYSKGINSIKERTFL